MGLRNKRPDLNGLLVIDKPLGWTSTRVVTRVRRATGGARVGHAGTLDPLATGVLVICIGKGTRLVESLMAQPKQYRAVIDLSRVSESHDLERETTTIAVTAPPDRSAVEHALRSFAGNIMQLPPAHSAVWIDGKRAYELARKGKLDDSHAEGSGLVSQRDSDAARLEPRPVRIDHITIDRYHWPQLALTIDCGKGTYIRSIARDIGLALKTGGVLTSLVRTRSGSFAVEQAMSMDAMPERIDAHHLIPLPDPGPVTP